MPCGLNAYLVVALAWMFAATVLISASIHLSKSLRRLRLKVTSAVFTCGRNARVLKDGSRNVAIQWSALMNFQNFSSMYFLSLARNSLHSTCGLRIPRWGTRIQISQQKITWRRHYSWRAGSFDCSSDSKISFTDLHNDQKHDILNLFKIVNCENLAFAFVSV